MRGRGAWALLTLMVLAAGVAGCGGTSGDAATGTVPATPAGKAEAANFNGVHAGEVEAVLQIKRLQKKKPEGVKMRIIGTFAEAGEAALPQLDLAIESYGELGGTPIEFLSGPLLRNDKWVINFARKVYEPDQATVEELQSKIERAGGEEGGEGNPLACVEAAEGFSITDVLRHVSFEGEDETSDGTKLETVGADFDVPAAIDELIELSERSPGCKAQMEAVGLPPTLQLEHLEKELDGGLTEARLTLSLDRHGILRYFKIVANDELPGGEELEVEVHLRLSRVNEPTDMPIAYGSSPYPALLKQFGLSGEDVERADAGEIWVGVLGVLADRMFGREGA